MIRVLIFHCQDGGWLYKAADPVNGVFISVERPTLEAGKRVWQRKHWDLIDSLRDKGAGSTYEEYYFCMVADAAYEDYIEQCARAIWSAEEDTDNISVRVIDDFEYIESQQSSNRSDAPDHHVYLPCTEVNIYELEQFTKKLDIGLTNMTVYRDDDGDGLVLFWNNTTVWHPASQEGMFMILTRRDETDIWNLKEVRQSYLMFHNNGDILLADKKIGTWSVKELSFTAEVNFDDVHETLSDTKKFSLLQQVAKVIPDRMLPLAENDLKKSVLQTILRL